ncbi:MAG: class I SAM-dependent rRNA methyltransferase [bacterium]
MEIAALQLKKHHDRRIRAGHAWIYSNEVDIAVTPLKGLQPGEPVAVLNDSGKWLGWGYVNPDTLICGRIVSRDREHFPDQSMLVHRIKIALSLRERLYPHPHYRLIFGETDGLPGLVVDRFGDYLSVQLSTAGMEAMREEVIAALVKVLKPVGVILRNDSPVRELEGIARYVEIAHGSVPDMVPLMEGDARFHCSLHEGQKTGWFFDQAANRERLLKYVEGKRVLDCFSYAGAWGIRAVLAGASEATCVDASSVALSLVDENAKLNGVEQQLSTIQQDAFAALKELRHQKEKFDVIIVDPPAFIKRKKDLKEGTLAYRRINEAAISLLSRDGLLVSASCSHHMTADSLLRTVQQAARQRDRSLQLLETGQQGPDHPIQPAIPETHYLKAFYFRVLPSF